MPPTPTPDKSIDFRPALEGMISEYKEAAKDGELCPHEYLQLVARGCQVLESLVGNIGENDAEFEKLVDDCEWAVQTYVVPYDIPVIKDFVEDYVIDPNLNTLVRPALVAMRVKINKHSHKEEEGDEVE